jgi:SAM-dependent methyltransferase
VNLECPFHEFSLPEEGGACPECGFVVETTLGGKHHFRRVGEPKGIYDSYEDAYEGLAEDDLASSIYAEEYQRDLARETYSCIGSVSGLEVAELGVGQGFLQRHLLEAKPKSLLALDIAENYVRNVRHIYESSGNESTSFLTSVGNVEFMPYRESFDVVVATDILEHVLNHGNALSRISRMLKTNGRFWCRVPNEEVLGQYSIYNGQKYEFAHLRFFDKSSLCAQLKEAGFGSFSCNKFGFQAHRLKLGLPSLVSRVLGKLFALSGFYGSEVHHFNRKMRNSFQWPVRILHQPLEILVGATKK